MSSEIGERMATAEADVANIRRDIDSIKTDMREVLTAIREAKGGWKGIAAAIALATPVGAVIAWLIAAFHKP